MDNTVINTTNAAAVDTEAPREAVTLKVTAENGLCLRRAPTTNAPVMEVLAKGAAVETFRDALGGAWVAVRAKSGHEGHVMAKFVKEVK